MGDLLDRPAADLASYLARTYIVGSLDDLQSEIDKQRRVDPLRRFVEVLNLSATEAGDIFGVSRQAFTKWLTDGVPADRLVEIADVDEGVRWLLTKLRRDTIATVARRPAPDLAGRTLLEVLKRDGAAAFVQIVRAMFDFGDAHG